MTVWEAFTGDPSATNGGAEFDRMVTNERIGNEASEQREWRMKKQSLIARTLVVSILSLCALLSITAPAQEGGHDGGRRKSRKEGRPDGGRGRNSSSGETSFFHTEVPEHTFDIILGRPTKNSVTLSVLAYVDMEGYFAYGTRPGMYPGKTKITRFEKCEPVQVVIESLQPNTPYYYQLRYRRSGSAAFSKGKEAGFHTQRPTGSSFTFSVQADSHLDENANPEIYARTLENALADAPDFHIDLGDTFMIDKLRDVDPLKMYLAQRYYFGLLCHSAPLYFVLGNHDGESGRNDTAVTSMRKKYYPNPFPNEFYTGNTTEEKSVGLLEDYYAWQWGDGLFVVLDPFPHARPRGRERDEEENWYRTLGGEQYQWLKKTLEGSKAKFKFVFIHHLVGGLDSQGRGGSEAAKYFEWGGCGKDGNYEFEEKRPGWDAPIHQLLVRHNVSIVFHGHDHFFAKQDLDGIVYQLVPQPGSIGRDGAPRTAQEYGYVSGELLGGAGYMRVRVSAISVTVDYVRSCLPDEERGNRKNGEVAYSYTIPADKEIRGKEMRPQRK